MAEKDIIFSSTIKSVGIFSFKDFYRFCHEWLTEETGLDVSEDKYEEKIKGDIKEMNVEWTGTREITDYFKFEIKVKFEIRDLKDVEIMQEGVKVSMNQGSIKTSVKGTLIRDYEGKFETTASKKFMRSVYEKWIIPSRIDQMEDKIAEDCNEFLAQAKSWLDLEGKK